MDSRKKALIFSPLGLVVGILLILLANWYSIRYNSGQLTLIGFLLGGFTSIYLGFQEFRGIRQTPAQVLIVGAELFVIYITARFFGDFRSCLFAWGGGFFIFAPIITFIEALLRKGRFIE